ncbi:MAG: DMT family transporter, partial [Gammaproteobacteria bacterium]|nr:DMT family transporter [Gammaproteobacteria bacterium]
MNASDGTTRAVFLTGVAMLAFAGNSILCRLALRDGAIDPASFTSVRLVSGAVALMVILWITRRGDTPRAHGSWLSACMLFFYAICFSYAYITLSAGAGALILFGFVQGTMIAIGIWSGDRPTTPEWLGWSLAFAGLVWLVLPGVEAPPWSGASLMAVAGIAWGVYSIRGRTESDALASTASNFMLTVPMVAVLTLVTFTGADISTHGITLAIVSGAITSGIGYVIWYAALEYLSAIQAALVQLSVPAIATAGGVVLLLEPLSLRLLIASALVLGGISIA